MKKKLAFGAIAVIVLGLVLLVCSYMKMQMAKEKTEGRTVKNAAAIRDELGIDISMPEEIYGASDFKYSIIDEKVGRVSFQYKGREYYLLATRGAMPLEEMGFVKSDEWWEGTTLYAAGDFDPMTGMTGIVSFGLEDDSSLVQWNWDGIEFLFHSPKEYQSSYGFIEEIASNSFYQPTIEQEATEE